MEGLNGTFECKLINPRPRILRDDNDQVRRVTNFALVFDADDDLAAGIGEAAVDALRHVRSGAQKSASILFDAVQCKIVFDAGKVEDGKHTLDKAAGVRATLARSGVEDATPKLTLTLATATRQEDLWWMVQHMDINIKAKIVASQLELPATKKPKKEEPAEETLPGTEA